VGTLEDPARVERPDPVRLAADVDEVARARVHRQPRLDGIEQVVPGDQVVDGVEPPGRRAPAPRALQPGRVAAGKLFPLELQRVLVRCDLRLDLAQAPRVRRRAGQGERIPVGGEREVP
jgi:hypothetical protein